MTLVIFAGAGVSVGEPANLPNFLGLVQAIAQGTGQQTSKDEPLDRFLGKLEKNGADVHARAKDILTQSLSESTALHRDLLRLYPHPESVRVVTTNFDLLFEHAAISEFDSSPEVFRTPALPLGNKFNGIVHLHGSLDHPDDMILTDADFGSAYLIDGRTSRFLVEMFRSFTVLFAGYSHDDTVMHYFARALPISETKRFILTDEPENERWGMLGIEPIAYQSHSDLYEYVHDLSSHVRRGILDWKREITDLLQKPPSLNERETDLVEEALEDEAKILFFLNTKPAVEWLDWFDSRNYFDDLFRSGESGEFDKRNQLLAQWLAWEFACSYPDVLFQLIGKHGIKIHPYFWFELGRAVGSEQNVLLDGKPLSRWVSLLLATAPADSNIDVLSWLGERCINADLTKDLLEIFDAMATDLFGRIPFGGWSGPEERGWYEIKELWEKGLKPNLNLIAVPLLDSATKHLVTRYRLLNLWEDADHYEYSESLGRSAIEPHEQDEYPESLDVVIDVIRDCLEWLACNQPSMAEIWCDRLINTDVPLFHRIAIYALSERMDLTPDEKIDWLLDKTDIHELLVHHEIFQTMYQAYKSASPEHRQTVIQAVLAYRHPHQEDKDQARQTAHQHFAWLHWLHKAAPQCDLTKRALENVRKQYPDFRASEHPDFFHWTETTHAALRDQSPWSAKELLAQPAEVWSQELLSFQRTSFDGPSREGLLGAVQEAASRKLDWGLALANELISHQKWEADLWKALIHAWKENNLNENDSLKVLGMLNETKLHQEHARSIAEMLRKVIKYDETLRSQNFLQRANEVAGTLWRNIDHEKSFESIRDWFTLASIHPAGILTQFWLESWASWRKQQDPMPDTFNDEYRLAFTEIVRNEATTGKLGRSVLAHQFSFLLNSDEKWVKENMLPLFLAQTDVSEYQAIWDGFLYGSLSIAIADLMEDAFLQAATRVESDLSEPVRQKRFIESYTVMLAYFVKQPSEAWIPMLFQHGGEKAQHNFTHALGLRLGRMNDTQKKECWDRWLKSYWENRLRGVPKPIGSNEVVEMLGWLLDLEVVFPDAVDLAVKMPKPIQHKDTRIVYLLNKSSLWETYPSEVARLLIYLGNSQSPSYIWYRGEELIQKLLSSDLSEDLKRKLEELMASKGLG
ncbi:MAG: DUF4020 domain-containing protein [Gammaproteobacteria bacterium]|nr:DUF4020 domain-containing protein [Gammaproteobacteria bacterium]